MKKFEELMIDVLAESVLDAISLFEEDVQETIAYNSIMEESNVSSAELLESLLEEESSAETKDEVKNDNNDNNDVVQESTEDFDKVLDSLLSEFASEE